MTLLMVGNLLLVTLVWVSPRSWVVDPAFRLRLTFLCEAICGVVLLFTGDAPLLSIAMCALGVLGMGGFYHRRQSQ